MQDATSPDDAYLRSALGTVRSKLLDRSGRSRLINYKELARDIGIIDEMPNQVYAHLIGGNPFVFDALKAEAESDGESVEGSNGPSRILPRSVDPSAETDDRYRDDRLQTPFGREDLERRLQKLYREHLSIINETGANNLYLAFGFLRWTEERESDQVQRLAPLMLLPVRLSRDGKPGAQAHKLRFDDGAIDTNYSLAEKLLQSFRVRLPKLAEGATPEEYLEEVQSAMQTAPHLGFEVVRQMALGLFQFQKQVMWNDLDPDRWPASSSLLSKPLVRRILTGAGNNESGPGIRTDPVDLHSATSTANRLKLIRDADSSQQTALVDALDLPGGLVIEGPPGTGKSQTITNLIAAAIAEGQSVLFVAEKMEALKVVFDRLQEVGLDDFCLQLHGLRTGKKDLLKSIHGRLNRRAKPPQDIERQREELAETKARLIEYSSALREKVGPQEIPLHDVAWRLEEIRFRLPESFRRLEVPLPSDLTYTHFVRCRSLLENLGREWGAIPAEAIVAWSGLVPGSRISEYRDLVLSALEIGVESTNRLAGWIGDAWPDPGLASSPPSRFLDFRSASISEHLPETSSGISFPLLAKVIEGESLDDLNHLIADVERYLSFVKAVDHVVDFSSDMVESRVEMLRTHISPLNGVACHSTTTVASLGQEANAFQRIEVCLSELNTFAVPVVALTGMGPRTLADYAQIAEKAIECAAGPDTLFRCSSIALADFGAPRALSEAMQHRNEIEAVAASLENFDLALCANTKEIRDASEVVSSIGTSRLRIFNSEYRSARRTIRGLLAKPRTFKAKPEFFRSLSEVVRFCELRDGFAAHSDFSQRLGPAFHGLETKWEQLDELVAVGQRLRLEFGEGQASEMLRDWSEHVRKMGVAQRETEQRILRIREFFDQHPFSSTLHRRPVAEIVTDLASWREKVEAAANALDQHWCSPGVTLGECQDATDAYRDAVRAGNEIEVNQLYSRFLPVCWDGPTTRSERLHVVSKWVTRALGSPGMGYDILKCLIRQEDGIDRELMRRLWDACGEFTISVSMHTERLASVAQLDRTRWFESASLSGWVEKLRLCRDHWDSLELIERWQAHKKEAHDAELSPFCSALDSGTLTPDQCGPAYEFSVYDQVWSDRIEQSPILKAFGRMSFEGLRERFAELDQAVRDLNAADIASTLCKMPIPDGISGGRASEFTELGLIRRELAKKRAHIPIRQLVARAPSALKASKPCFLMSPLSVAQFLPPGKIEFDLVVMDEASQIRPEEALGALARGKRAVIVGDPKQLPPTSFFDTAAATDDDAEETVIDDAESILDVALIQLPFRRLRWHYRSNHEDLIRFSNEQFYDGDLLVFPSPRGKSRTAGVHSNFIVNPSYSAGRNRGEALEVVKAIAVHFHNHPEQSLGVATANRVQAEEVQLLLDRARRQDPLLNDRIAKAEDSGALFIKNLENVQGDERDVIFISMTYGPPSPNGPVKQRFGPINSNLGWRRLNVIATRARERVEVFTSMRPQDVIIGDNASLGVRALRNYLEYAESGRVMDHGRPTGGDPESEFEVSVGRIIKNFGYNAVPQVGVDGFYIDIGVEHPNRAGEYLMGIECDGAAYHTAASVRDRDRLRQEVLESKGWHIHRIWSTSWYHARDSEITRLRNAIETRLGEDRGEPAAQTEWDGLEDLIPSIVFERDETESLSQALDRFWEQNIKPSFPSRAGSVLSYRLVTELSSNKPVSEKEWQTKLSDEVRASIDSSQEVFIPDILSVIAEYR